MQEPHRHPYVAIGERGLLKVGMAQDVHKRWQSLRQEFASKGDALLQMYALPALEAAYSVERTLIVFCAKAFQIHSGREWFQGACIQSAIDALHEAWDKWRAHSYYRAPPQSAEQRAYCERLRQQRAEWKAQRRLAADRRRAERARAAAIGNFGKGRSRRVFNMLAHALTLNPAEQAT